MQKNPLCSDLFWYCWILLFRDAHPWSELAIQDGFDILVTQPVQGFQQYPGR